MFPHWRYVLDHIFGTVRSVQCSGAMHVPQRVDEKGTPYACTADDAAYATFELEGGIVAQFNSSWATRVYRDDLFMLQVDGTHGSAVAGLTNCKAQDRAGTPRAVWDPDVPSLIDFRGGWKDVPNGTICDNAFRVEWELYLRSLAEEIHFVHDFWDGARGVQLAELALQSWKERRWVDVPPLQDGGDVAS